MTPMQLRILLVSVAELIDAGMTPDQAVTKTMLTAYETGLVQRDATPPHVPPELIPDEEPTPP